MGEGNLITKPQLRNLHRSGIKKNLIVAVAATCIVGIVYKIVVTDMYEKKFTDFYKTYDGEAALKVMNDAGLMESCPKN